ncbi:AAA family ATPase [Maribellus comscasis]|jgi:predicted AAA+ superfamily ATPase|uniref:AAA family ATPase n=1 Tax=Maribellus comscasis TaxID=2681766 RepID=A0A6I6K7C3_9BACT|nr:ATP-binding protein [Maribellus comscasis]QGY45904.1 AAA family ATPase [Maribellus comscasis]
MYRESIVSLKKWKEDKFRKPLIVRGARQVGKTWLLQEFGRTSYDKLVYVNFEETPALQNIFSNDFDIERIITVLQIQAQTTITAEDTLIVLDEIQSAERGVTSLKYFCENAPQYHIIAAGSLLGMGLHSQVSFPVGKVDFLDLRPLSFYEFLLSLNESALVDALKAKNWGVISIFTEKLKEYLRYYFYVGGMPEVVSAFVQTRDWQLVRRIQSRILNSYEGDFSKHAPNETVPRIRMVWQSIPSQLAKENKKFVYGVIREGARAKDFELAIQWLVDCGLLLKSHRVSKPGIPLAAYQEISVFKLFLHDVGLLGAMAGLDVRTIIEGDEIFTEFKGALTEQYVMQQLRLNSERYIGYWTNERSTSEVDFVIQEEGKVIPVEVKSGENLKARSFRLFCEKYKPSKAIRTSLTNYKEEEWMINVPLYAIGEGNL